MPASAQTKTRENVVSPRKFESRSNMPNPATALANLKSAEVAANEAPPSINGNSQRSLTSPSGAFARTLTVSIS